jgi:hypothetical protein
MTRCRHLIGRQHGLTRHQPSSTGSPVALIKHPFARLYGLASGSAQNAQICTSSVVTGLEPASAQIGGYTRVLPLWINHALRSASDAKAAGAAAPRVRA